MKKKIAIILCLFLMTGLLSGCGTKTPVNNNSKISIVATIFPAYDWVKQILGEKASEVELTMLLDKGVDLHNYQPTADDMIKISTCDLFLYVGGESDSWVGDALKNATNKDMVVINLLDVLGDAVKLEEVVEGMQESEHEHEHGEDEEHDHEDGEEHEHEDGEEHEEHEEEIEYDEHVWLSLKNAGILCKTISEKLSGIDPENKESYSANLEKYLEKLTALDKQYQSAVDAAAVKTVLFGDRFPFRYLVDDYGLTYYAAFVGCSAETEASFETITFLAGKVDELSLPAVLTIEGKAHRIAETIVENTKQKNQTVLVMDSMQATTAVDVANGVTFLSIMEKNLETLKQALR